MLLNAESTCDVLVVGSGIAGIMAAVKAAQSGKSVTLLCGGNIFSGSSFYPGTWGLGLIGPCDEADEEDLAKTIIAVGCGMADKELVGSFVKGITPAVKAVKNMGVELRTAQDAEQKDFIPCFDHKHRSWNGIIFESAKKVFSEQMKTYGVVQLSHCELLDIDVRENSVRGAVYRDADNIHYIGCKALVLATGGYGGLFEKRLTTDDNCGTGQYMALKAGCTLVNMEFMQMMPGYISPSYKTIFNERTFRYSRFFCGDRELFTDNPDKQRLLELRSTHGPFTSRLSSKEVDFVLSKAAAASKDGVEVHYNEELKTHMPEFIKTYFDWLWEKKGLTVSDKIYIDMFAHAANGGIKINSYASTGVMGLFACGEITGGMHGADRIGGLSTANGLVFGIKAGASAAEYSGKQKCFSPMSYSFDMWKITEPEEKRREMRKIMGRCAMVVRSESSLTEGLKEIQSIIRESEKIPTSSVSEAANSRRLWAQLNTAMCILQADLLRRESRGSHFREDYPRQLEEMERRILIKGAEDKFSAAFENDL